MKKMRFEDTLVGIFCYAFMIICGLVTILPVMNLLAKSVSMPQAVTSGSVGIIPVGFQLQSLGSVLSSMNFLRALKNSVTVTALGTVIAIIITALTAFPLSKRHLWGMKPVLMLFVFTMMFSGGLIPTYLLIRNLKLYNSLWSLMLPNALNVYNMLIIKNYFENIPASIEESAKIDGANNLTIFFRMILPLSKPVLATISLFTMVALWNSYFDALIYIDKPALKTLQLYMSDVIMEAEQDLNSVSIDDLMNVSPEGVRCATIIASTLPIVLVYPFLQKYFVKGIMIGSVKG